MILTKAIRLWHPFRSRILVQVTGELELMAMASFHALHFPLQSIPVGLYVLCMGPIGCHKLETVVNGLVASYTRKGTHTVICSPLVRMNYCARLDVGLNYRKQCCCIPLLHYFDIPQGRLMGHIHHSEHPHFLL